MRRLVPVLLAAALIMAPLSARAADLVAWWDEGYYPEGHVSAREIIAAIEQDSGKQVELVFHLESKHPEAIAEALRAGKLPDFAFSMVFSDLIGQWAFDDRLVDLTDAIG